MPEIDDRATISFGQRLLEASLPELDVAVGLLWHESKFGRPGLAPNEIARIVQEAGGPAINSSRLKGRLKADSRVVSNGDRFKANIRSARQLDEKFGSFAGPMRPANSGSVIDAKIFEGARKYVKNVVWQINAAYDNALFDCCAVMCRRLFETLLIDAFDNQGELNLIKNSNGDILMLSGIISVIKQQKAFNVGRQTKQAADRLKNVGDWSAHNRTFIAQARHIDDIADDLYMASLDLLHLAGQD